MFDAHCDLYKTVLEDKRIAVLEHPSFSPDLTTYDFYLFLKVENAMMGKHFQSVGRVNVKTPHLLKMVTPTETQHHFERLKTHMQLCIDREGEYAERDQKIYSERWPAVRCIETGQCIKHVARFFEVSQSLISQVWKQLQKYQTAVRGSISDFPRFTIPVSYCCRQAKSKIDRYKCDIYGSSYHW
ncbi:hypothetical protein TNCV_232161 [Trichonephila clavipes]|nr:hypothetical protein TNCV_232161 [Trichonephila clavipes]